MNARFKALIGLVLLFAAGIGTGIMLAPHLRTHEKPPPFQAEAWTENTVAEYQARLSLNVTDTAKVRAAASHAATEILRIRGETQENIRTTIKQMNATLIPSISEAQQAILQQWLEQKRSALLSK